MNSITQYFPRFTDLFLDKDSNCCDFSTLEELFNVPFVKYWVESSHFVCFYKGIDSLIVELDDGDYVVVGFIKDIDKVDLPRWIYKRE